MQNYYRMLFAMSFICIKQSTDLLKSIRLKKTFYLTYHSSATQNFTDGVRIEKVGLLDKKKTLNALIKYLNYFLYKS